MKLKILSSNVKRANDGEKRKIFIKVSKGQFGLFVRTKVQQMTP